MEYDELDGPDGAAIRVPKTQDYRTCSACGSDCYPDPSTTVEGEGVTIAFVCAEHGLQSLVDPFEDQR